MFDSYLENSVKNMTRRRKIKENCNINCFNEEIKRLKRRKIDKYSIYQYINNKINNATYEKMFKVITNFLYKKNRSAVECKHISDIADNFGKYFIISMYVNRITVINSKFKFREITLEELSAISKSIKKKS